jgi:hypothetical protein
MMMTPPPYISASTSRCPRCEATDIRPALVTGFGAYWRCAPCGHSWLVPRVLAAPSRRTPGELLRQVAAAPGEAGEAKSEE